MPSRRSLPDAFVKMGGKYLFIDEIYKYKDWAIYDYVFYLTN